MNLSTTKLDEIEARLRALAASILGVLPVQAGNAGKFLKTDGAAASWDTPAAGGASAVYVQEGGAAEADSSAADLTVNFADADFDITTVGQTSTVAINDGGIAHSGLAGTHNLTTDIDHDSLTNFAANEHFVQTAITNVNNALATGILKVTTGTGALSVASAGTDYAAAANGVTNGDSHDHSGGDGAQIDHGSLAGLGDDDHTQYVLESLFDANTILAANSDNTPAAVTVAEQRIVGRITGGNIAALTGSQTNGVIGAIRYVKTADQIINNSNAYTDDTHLTGISLEASSQYNIHISLINTTVTATPDIKWQLVSSQADWAMTGWGMSASETAAVTASAGANFTRGAIAYSSGATRVSNWGGIITTTTACTIKLQWAQNAATAEDTTLRKGSFIQIFKLPA